MSEDRVTYRRLILDLFIVKRKNVTELQFKKQQLAGLEFKEGELYPCIVHRQVLLADMHLHPTQRTQMRE